MTDRSPEFHGYSRHTCLTHPSDMQSSEYNSLQQLHSLPFFLWTLSSAVVSLFHSCVSASCINNRRYMPISLLTPLCSITVPFDADAVQERDSSVEPQGSLPVFEIVFQTFCLVLWQDTSLLLTALLQAKKKKPQWHPAFFPFYWEASIISQLVFPSDTVVWAGLRGAEGDVEAEQPRVS